jgi:hypothetical protein
MDCMDFRPILAPVLGLALCFTFTPRPGATAKDAVVAHYVGRAVSIADDKDVGRIDIYIERWSPDADQDKLLGAVRSGADKLLPTLETVHQRFGVLTFPGVQAEGPRVRSPRPRNLQYTRQIETSAGRQIVVAANRHVGLGEYERWGLSADPDFTLIDIRFGPNGVGVGKAVPATKVAYNETTKVLEVKDFSKEPVRLRDVRLEEPERSGFARYYQPTPPEDDLPAKAKAR